MQTKTECHNCVHVNDEDARRCGECMADWCRGGIYTKFERKKDEKKDRLA